MRIKPVLVGEASFGGEHIPPEGPGGVNVGAVGVWSRQTLVDNKKTR